MKGWSLQKTFSGLKKKERKKDYALASKLRKRMILSVVISAFI